MIFGDLPRQNGHGTKIRRIVSFEALRERIERGQHRSMY
jgi:hypothetical protein